MRILSTLTYPTFLGFTPLSCVFLASPLSLSTFILCNRVAQTFFKTFYFVFQREQV